MKKILILMGRYLPGYKDGGPLRTIINVTDALGDECEFYIACYDRDHGDVVPYKEIKKNKWNKVRKARVFYVEPGGFTRDLILKLVKDKDLIYLCNFYESYGYKTLLLKKIKKINVPVVVASMGVFAKEAQKQKLLKKKVFLTLCKMIGLFNNITWSVTSELEAADVKRVLGNNIKYVVAEDLPRASVPGRKKGDSDNIKIVFLSRICKHKNPKVLIDAIGLLEKHDNLVVDFYGPIQDSDYWNDCLEKLNNLNVSWKYGGEVPSERVPEVLGEYDVFVLPSESENYGHVVFEALSVGCIPVISDRTPWQLGRAGYTVELKTECFAKTIDEILCMDSCQRKEMSKEAVELAKKKVQQAKEDTGYRKIFM